MDTLMKDPVLSGARPSTRDARYVQSEDCCKRRLYPGQESFVRVQVVYDERLLWTTMRA